MKLTARLETAIPLLISTAILMTLLSGCLTAGNAARKSPKEIIAEKIKNFSALKEAIDTQQLKNGMSATAIAEDFGQPDDILSSGSSTGRFEIWSYEELAPNGQPTWQSIRLYFSNNKLISWNY